MINNQTIFIVSLEYGIIDGVFLEENEGKYKVSLNCPDGKKIIKSIPKNSIYLSLEDAQIKYASLKHYLDRKKLSNAVNGNKDFLPEHIKELNKVYPSGNPLRLGEPKISFILQTNVAGEDDNPEKVIQTIGAIWEDIEMLMDILYVISFANEYTKKLIGKYLIIELKSLSACFERLSELDNNYKENLYPEFLEKIRELDNELKFGVIPTPRDKPNVRNKISAHRDLNLDLMTTMSLWGKITRNNIFRYIEIFSNHINKFMKQYPNEANLYFNMRKTPFKDITDVKQPKDNSYNPFDEKMSLRDDVDGID